MEWTEGIEGDRSQQVMMLWNSGEPPGQEADSSMIRL